ncbi:MAG: hypothetical protein AB1486_11910 [Planctomycetota bacterium]
MRFTPFALTVAACSLGLSGHLAAGTDTDTYLDISATISGPDTVEPGADFTIDVHGEIIGGGAFDVYAYALVENAVWHYDSNHLVVVDSGVIIDADGFNFGNTHDASYVLNRPAGTYGYLWVFGKRSGGHGYYDVGVEIQVVVQDPCVAELDAIDAYVQYLPIEVFRNHNPYYRWALQMDLGLVRRLIEAQDYSGAESWLEQHTKTKVKKWLAALAVRNDLLAMIDNLIVCLQGEGP